MKRILIIILVIITYSGFCYSSDITDEIYWQPKETTKKTINYMDYLLPFGFGGGFGEIKTPSLTHSSFELDLICLNVFMTYKFGKISDCNDELYDASSMQFGILIPTIGFGGTDFIGRKHKGRIFVAPIIEFVSSDKTHFDGHYLHENVPFHNCQYWISDETTTDYKCNGFGGAVLVKYNMGYIMGKVTNKGFGISLGVCM